MASGRLGGTDRLLAGGLGGASSLPAGMGVGGSSYQELLPKLTQETELQKLLADEKMRGEQHRTNYQTLKAEHTRLQNEYSTLQTELRATIEESKLVQEKYKALMEQLRKELSDKQSEIEQLKTQTLSAQKLEMLRIQLTEEVEKPFQDKYRRLDEETERYRGEYNKLKYEFSFLKAEYEHERVENQRVIEEMKMRHEAEVTNLRRERESLISRQTSEAGSDSQRLRGVQRENTQLQLKLKGVLAELAEVRADKEHSGLQTDNVTRLQTKQLAEHTATIKALETEKDSLKLQVSSLQTELTTTNDLQTQLTSRIHDLEKDNIQLKGRAEEVSHKSKVELTNLKMEMLKERGELERERDRLLNEIEELKSQVDIVKHSLDKQTEAVVEKERECVRRVQAAREEEWQKIHAVENEKLDLEAKVQALQRSKIDEESERHAMREKSEDKLRQATEANQDLEKQILVLKTKQQHQTSALESLERERNENSELKTRLHRIEAAYNGYVGSERQLVDNNGLLKRQNQELSQEVKDLRDKCVRVQEDSARAQAQSQTAWQDEKANLQRRVDELDDQLSTAQNQVAVMAASQSKKKKKYNNLVTRLKHKLTLSQAKVEELSIERETLKKSVPSSAHLQLKKQLKELLSRHRDFRMLLLSSDLNEISIGNIPYPSAKVTADDLVKADVGGLMDLEKQHRQDLELLKERLDMLDNNQKLQLQELRGVSPLTSPRLDDIEPPAFDEFHSPERDIPQET